MNKDKQRIKIAEACGYTDICMKNVCVGYEEFVDDYVGVNKKISKNKYQIPDYLNDLNAMNEAEKTLTDKQYSSDFLAAYEDTSFTGWLYRIMVRRVENPDFRICSASAAQRAEAFLRALELWEDDK